MKRIFLILLLVPATAFAQNRVDVTCGTLIPTTNVHSAEEATTFQNQCNAAGGITYPGTSGTDSNGPYTQAVCMTQSCANASTSTPPATTGSVGSNPPQTTAAAPTSQNTGKLTYTPLEPLNGKTDQNTYNSLSAYLALVFSILLSLGAMVAIVTLVLAGITYIVSEVAGKKEAARRRIQASITGLLLLLTSWLILNAVNPKLLTFTLALPGTPGGVANTFNTATTINTANNPVNVPANTTTQAPSQAQVSSCEAQTGCSYQAGPSGSSCQCPNAL